MTNEQQIKSMGVKALARWFSGFFICSLCPVYAECSAEEPAAEVSPEYCANRLEEWLMQESE